MPINTALMVSELLWGFRSVAEVDLGGIAKTPPFAKQK